MFANVDFSIDQICRLIDDVMFLLHSFTFIVVPATTYLFTIIRIFLEKVAPTVPMLAGTMMEKGSIEILLLLDSDQFSLSQSQVYYRLY